MNPMLHHQQKEYHHHELVPIVTMSDNTTSMLPEMLENLPSQLSLMSMSTSGQSVSNVLTGVYTLTEEPELEAEENTTM